MIAINNYQHEVSLNNFVPQNYLKNVETPIFFDNFKTFTVEEKLLLVVLDRDGYFYSSVKPSPVFLMILKRHEIFIQAFCLFNNFKRNYGCFLKSFALSNPDFKPTSYIR